MDTPITAKLVTHDINTINMYDESNGSITCIPKSSILFFGISKEGILIQFKSESNLHYMMRIEDGAVREALFYRLAAILNEG